MSTQPQPEPQVISEPTPKKGWRWKHTGIVALSVLGILLLCVAILAWYANTPQFQDKVRRYVVASLEQATGGKVELKGFRWRLLHLEVEVQNLTIHGLEAPNEIPYAHIDDLRVRAKILAFLSPKIGLNLLEVQHPVFHLIVYPDGTTNQPQPKQKRAGKPLKDTLFDLQADRTEIANGLILVNQKAIPFDLAGNDLGVKIAYQPGANQTDRYIGNLTIADLMAQRGKRVPVRSKIDANIEFARNALSLKSFQLRSGGSSLLASGALNDFNHPQWQFASSGSVDVREVEALAAVGGLQGGVMNLDLKGKGAQGGKLDIGGNVELKSTTYRTQGLDLSSINAKMQLHATDEELALLGIHAVLSPSGHVDGDFRLLNWLQSSTPVPSKPGQKPEKKSQQIQGVVRASLSDVALQTVMGVVASPRYRDLGFDTLISGPAKVDWTGSASNLTVDAQLKFTPSSHTPPGEVPLSGVADALYDNRRGQVDIRTTELQTPGTHLKVTGGLGVHPVTQASQLNVDLTTSNLAEMDKTLAALGLNSGQKKGSQVLPIELHGQAEFHGTVTQSLLDPDVKGHVVATNFSTVFPSTTPSASGQTVAQPVAATTPSSKSYQWDRLEADAEYSSEALSIQRATVNRGQAVIQASGQLRAHRISAKVSKFDEASTINADVQIQNAAVPDVLAMVGENYPVTGTITFHSHIGGHLNDWSGGGNVLIQGGQIYGEPYRSLNSDLVFSGQEVALSRFTFLQNGGQIQGSGGFDLKSKQFHIQATGSRFELAHFQKLQNSRYRLAGQLGFQLQGKGTVQDPSLTAQARIVNLAVAGEPMGSVSLDAHTQQRKLLYHLSSDLKSAHLEATGQTGLEGDYPTQATLNFSQLDIDSILKLADVESISGHSAIAGEIAISGPAKQPRKLNGDAKISQLAVTLQGVALKSEGPLHASLNSGVLHLDQVHITGEDTDLQASGNLGVIDRHDINMQMKGAVNLKLMKTVNPDLIASGIVNFNLDAAGTLEKPNLQGRVDFKNAAIALSDFPNGLSQMNGNLRFNQNRLEVQNLTAVTGGGQLSLGGYLTYQAGLYGDLTATGKNVRIRYPQGVSSMADANLRLQGTKNNLILSGNVLITRFGLNPNLDFAAFAGSANAIAPVPNPDAPSNHVRLDVHITSLPQLNVQNSFAKLSLAGDVDLRVRGTVANPTVLGRVTVTEGSAVFNGTQYQLQRGEVFFTNPVRIEPNIDLDATARVEDYDITIGLHGTPGKLNVSYRSEPPLPQADVIALLAMGRTQDEQRYYQQQQQAAGANTTTDAILGGALNATVSNRVQKLFGVGSVKIDPTFVGSLGNSTARITVEQQVSKNVTLTYATNVNSTAQQLIQAEIDLTRTVSLVTTRDESGVFSMVVKVHRRYR